MGEKGNTDGSLGQRLYYLRKRRRLTLQELADLTGISRSNLNRYERGASKPTADFIKLLCGFYHVSADWLLFGGGKERACSKCVDLELERMMDCLTELMASENPHLRSWAIVQFANAFQGKV